MRRGGWAHLLGGRGLLPAAGRLAPPPPVGVVRGAVARGAVVVVFGHKVLIRGIVLAPLVLVLLLVVRAVQVRLPLAVVLLPVGGGGLGRGRVGGSGTDRR